MNYDWFIWRPILARIVTLEEMERHWSLIDLLDAHEALDVKMEMEAYAMTRTGK